MERSCVLPTTQFAFRKGLGTSDATLCMSRALQSALETEQEARIVQIHFSAAFDKVNNKGILNKFYPVGIEGSMLSTFTQFLSNRSQHATVDGCRSKQVNVLSRVPQESALGTILLLYISEHFFILENKLIGYADDSVLMAVVPSSGVRVTVEES